MDMVLTDTLTRLLDRLRCDDPRCPCHRATIGRGTFHCPVRERHPHGDATPSLGLWRDERGRLRVTCRSQGCDWRVILWRLRDVWPGTTAYEVRDNTGHLHAVHLRIDHGPKDKTFLWYRPDGTPGLGGQPVSALPLFGSERLSEVSTVVLTEGEKAAAALHAIGIAAVGTVTGASSLPDDAVLETLRGKRVWLWPDHDPAGHRHMEQIGTRLTRLGVAPLYWVAWPEAPEGGDAADAVARGGRALVEQLIEQAQPYPSSATVVVGSVCAEPSPPSWPTLDPAALHGFPGAVVAAVRPFTEASDVALLATFLAAVGNCIGPTPVFRVGTARHRLRLWWVLVGATSKARKGSSWDPVLRILHQADPAWAQHCVAYGLVSGEGLIWALRDPITARERRKEGNTTVFEDVTVDPGVTDKRLFVVEEEFASVLKAAARKENTLSQILRVAWERDDLRTLAKNSPARATGAHITVVGHITAAEARRYLVESEIAGGLANRFLWLAVRRERLLPVPPVPDDQLFLDLGAELADRLAVARTMAEIRWSPDAQAAWCYVYGPLSDGRPGLVGAMLARLEAHAVRLAALYAALDRSPMITLDHLEAALALVDYAEASTRLIFGEAFGDPIADTILAALAAGKPLTLTDVRDLFQRNVDAARIHRALAELEAAGLIARETTAPTTGRPTTIIRRRTATPEGGGA